MHTELQQGETTREKSRRILSEKLAKMIPPVQADFKFRPHSNATVNHNHEGDFGTEEKAILVRDAKELARRNPFESAGDIIDKVLDERRGTLKGHETVAPKQLARRINREKEAKFPRIDVQGTDYKIDLSTIPGTCFELLLPTDINCQFFL